MSEERSGGRRFNSATDAEILEADVADSYFHKTMRILRARGLFRIVGVGAELVDAGEAGGPSGQVHRRARRQRDRLPLFRRGEIARPLP